MPGYWLGRPLIYSETRKGHTKLRLNMVRIKDRKATHPQVRPGWPTQGSGLTWPGYQVGRLLIHSEARMAHTELRINMARISGRKATLQQNGPQRSEDQHGQDIR